MRTLRLLTPFLLAAAAGCTSAPSADRTPFQRATDSAVAPAPIAPENRAEARSRFDSGLALQNAGAPALAADRFTAAATSRPRMADAFVHRSATRRDGAPAPVPATAYPGRGFDTRETVARDAAREDAEQALRVVTEKRHPDAWVARGDAHRLSGDINRAITDYSEAIRIYPHYWVAFVRRGLARFDTADWKGAAADFAARLELKPADDSRDEAALRLWICRAKLAGRAAATAELRDSQAGLKGESAEIAAFLVSGRHEFESATGPLSERARFYVSESRIIDGTPAAPAR